jgi:CheY-like chemotaxis protein
MGGKIGVESIYGQGSTFSFYVTCEGPHEGNLASLSNPGQYKVLFFEPNPYHAKSAESIFASLGVNCRVVSDIAEFEAGLSGGNFTHVFFDKSAEGIVSGHAGKDGMTPVLVREANDVYGTAFPSGYISRPLFICNVVRTLYGDALKDAHDDGDEIALGAFKTKGVKVLLVDDNPVNLTVAKGLLVQYGVEVITASGGREAIEMAPADDYDIIFMDHMMPEIDGIEATTAIRALGGSMLFVPIIALSANAVSSARELFLSSGMNDFLSKPILIKDLHRLLLKYIPPEKISTDELIKTGTGE